jgi:hypothetical protein
MNSRWLAIWPDAPVTATRTVFCHALVRLGSSCGRSRGDGGRARAAEGVPRRSVLAQAVHAATIAGRRARAARSRAASTHARSRPPRSAAAHDSALLALTSALATHVGGVIRQPEHTILLQLLVGLRGGGGSGGW